MGNKKKGFQLRSFTSFSLVFSTIIMSWSGFILYVAPPGRIANWGDWKLMLFTKAEWQALHTIFSYMFFILFVIHLFFVNWKAFLTYFKSKIKAGLNRKWELIAATVVSGLFFIGTLESWTPFGPVMSFGEKVKESWDQEYVSPPVAHMEQYTLARFSEDFPEASVERIVKTLTDSGIVIISVDNTLKEIAEENGITPSRIYDIVTSTYRQDKEAVASQSPAGVGKLTVKNAAERLGMEPEELLKMLRENNIEVTEETTLRTIADGMGITPRDLYSLLGGK